MSCECCEGGNGFLLYLMKLPKKEKEKLTKRVLEDFANRDYNFKSIQGGKKNGKT